MKIKINEIEFVVNEKFNSTFWDHVASGFWEPQTFEIIDNFISEDCNVIDIGSWIGPLSLYMAGKGARVYSIEPDPIAYSELELNLKLNPILSQRIYPFSCAIVPDGGETKLYVRNSLGDSASSTLNRIKASRDGINVVGMSFDKFISDSRLKQVDFIKMDIEGGEFEVFPTIAPTLEILGLPTIFVSFHYSYLNEYYYHQKFRSRYLSSFLMKLEKLVSINLFRSKMITALKKIIKISEKYNFIYTEYGEEIKSQDLSPELMLENQMNLVLSNAKWGKNNFRDKNKI